MKRIANSASALLAAISLAANAPPAATSSPPALSPGEIVEAAKAEEWADIAPADLLVMELAADAKGRERRVIIQLMPPPFSQGWVGNVRKLALAHWWDGLSINRVQDNYVVQWGDADGEDKAKARVLPDGLATVLTSDYDIPNSGEIPEAFGDRLISATFERSGPKSAPLASIDSFSSFTSFYRGFPVAGSDEVRTQSDSDVAIIEGEDVDGDRDTSGKLWPVHCYATVGVARNLPPDTGTGAELYTVIGHAPRHLDRNIALIGRVIEGIEHMSSLPRGTAPLGFYASAEERVPIRSVRLGNEVAGLPGYQYLSTESQTFARYAEARANRRDAFFVRPAGGADICNIPVPVRRSTGSR